MLNSELHDEIKRAASRGEELQFMYQKLDDTLEQLRRLIPDPEDPIRENAEGDEFVIGHDPVKEAPRSYRLDRIGAVL